MNGRLLASRAGRRVALLGGLLVLAISAASLVTLLRYEHAVARHRAALEAQADKFRAQQAVTLFWRERESMNEYLVRRSQEMAGEVTAEQAEFLGATAGLGHDVAQEAALVAQARSQNDAFVAAFSDARERLRGGGASGPIVETLNAHESEVLPPLERLQRLYANEVTVAQRDAASARSQAVVAAVIGAVIAVAGTIAFVVYALILVARISERETDLQRTVERLSDRDSLLEQLRTASGTLAEVAVEMRAASREAAAATAEQSSAVAETSATVEQLAATATSIADNARSVAAAAEQTGETMRDMQEKVEAIAERSLSLGERSQKIGEILELINEIAEQTNLLALNAAIEAARAGEAGKGFAVVASEVKALAHRTTEATDQIVARIEDIRESTERSVVVIDKVGREVSQIDQASAGVATAVQEQEAALSEVARSITMASHGTAAVAASATAISAGARRIEEVTRGVSNVVRQTDHRLGDLRANVLVALRSSTSVERRAERRIPVNMAARVKIGGQTVDGRVLNISSQGAKLRHSDQQARFAEAQSIAIEIDGVGELTAQILTASNTTLHLQFRDVAPGLRTQLDRVIGDIEATDAKFIKAAQTAAADIARLFEGALDRDEIALHALFDTTYLPIDGTDPKQFSTQFVALCDRLLPAVQEPILELDGRVVFCAAVDHNGYLPTHNRVFSQPQRPGEVAWNTANSRNRRIFNDRAGLSAARSTRAHLLQTYERNMGGGRIDIMKEVDVPITVRGRHWGGLRLAYRA